MERVRGHKDKLTPALGCAKTHPPYCTESAIRQQPERAVATR
jgi:hypothetical protein